MPTIPDVAAKAVEEEFISWMQPQHWLDRLLPTTTQSEVLALIQSVSPNQGVTVMEADCSRTTAMWRSLIARFPPTKWRVVKVEVQASKAHRAVAQPWVAVFLSSVLAWLQWLTARYLLTV